MTADRGEEPPRRGTSLSPQDFILLDQWGSQLRDAFDETPYLVGSCALAARQTRDVDVRILLPEEAVWLAGMPLAIARDSWRLRIVNLCVTLWGRQVTGLPIDFQFQPPEEFHSYDGERRSALGISTRFAIEDFTEGRRS